MLRGMWITGFYCIDSAKREINTARTVLIKAMISSFYQYILAVFFITAE